MAGLGPAIHDLSSVTREIVDARPEAGHDEGVCERRACFEAPYRRTSA
jgi:hypothetical protein